MDRAIRSSSAKIEKSDNFMEGIFFGSALGIALFDTELRLVRANPAVSEVVGYSIEEIKEIDIVTELIPLEDATFLRQQVSLLVKKSVPSLQMQSRLKKKNGEWLVIKMHLSLLPAEKNEPGYVIVCLEDITKRKYAWSMLENSEQMHRLMARDLISAQETERRSVVLELHDVIGGNLGAAKYLLEKIKMERERTLEIWDTFVSKLDNLIVDTIDEVQRLSTSLRPPGLDDIGILAALGWLVRKHNEIYTEITTSFGCLVKEDDIPVDIKIVLFRVAQEALNNAAKHSQATFIEISLSLSEGKLILKIVDNGRGFNPEIVGFYSADRGLGLRNMQSRAELSDGKLTIWSRADHGTTIHAEWAMAGPEAA